MAVTGWLEIEYPVTDPVISFARVGTEQTVVLHAASLTQGSESLVHEQRAGTVSESTHIWTLDVVDLVAPRIRPGTGLDEDNASRATNVREMIRSLLRHQIVTVRPVGEHYLMRMPNPILAKLDGRSIALSANGLRPTFTLSLRLRQHGFATADF